MRQAALPSKRQMDNSAKVFSFFIISAAEQMNVLRGIFRMLGFVINRSQENVDKAGHASIEIPAELDVSCVVTRSDLLSKYTLSAAVFTTGSLHGTG